MSIAPHTPVRLTPTGYRQNLTRFGIPAGTPLEDAKGFTLAPDQGLRPAAKGHSWVDWETRAGRRPILVPNMFLREREPDGRTEATMGI